MAIIYALHGERILVDDEDFESLSCYSWHVSARGYAIRFENGERGKKLTVWMHRVVLGLRRGDKRQGDHRFGNKLDNRKSELRVSTCAQNTQNQPIRRNNTCGLKGVTRHKGTGRWQAQIRIDRRRKYLGQYASPEEAHEVYCLAADLLHGEFANHGAHA